VTTCKSLDNFLNQVNAKKTSRQITSQQSTDLRQQSTDLRQQSTGIQHTLGYSSSSLSKSLIGSMIDSTLSDINPLKADKIIDNGMVDKPINKDLENSNTGMSLFRDLFGIYRNK
jgi:hypothetical protein